MADSQSNTKPLVMIGLDAAELTLIQKWMEQGKMPNLQKLRERGAWGELGSTVDWLTGTPWPTFYTSQFPSEHGYYCYVQWRPDQMDHERPDKHWFPLTPFHRKLGERDLRTVVVDLPLCYSPDPHNGAEVYSWATHDKLWHTFATPPEVFEWVKKNYGPPPITDEITGLQKASELLKLRDELMACIPKQTDMCVELARDQEWDLFVQVFGATHRGGHKLWDETGCLGEPTEDEVRQLRSAYEELCVECDRNIGRFLESLDDDVSVMVFALHGMMDNTSRFDLLPEMLDRVMHDKHVIETDEPPKLSPLKRLREAVPLEWRNAVKRRLPQSIQDKLTLFWRGGGGHDWANTRAFATMGDLEAYVQINLKGRERDGIVEPGEEYEALTRKIIEGLKTFKDADTGEPIVREVGYGRDRWTEVPEDRRTDSLPDLIILWSFSPAYKHRMIESEKYGTIRWPTPGRNPDGRGGHHIDKGWFVLAGDHIEPGSTIEGVQGIDLAPTIMSLLGVEPFDDMRGRVVPEMAGTRADANADPAPAG